MTYEVKASFGSSQPCTAKALLPPFGRIASLSQECLSVAGMPLCRTVASFLHERYCLYFSKEQNNLRSLKIVAKPHLVIYIYLITYEYVNRYIYLCMLGLYFPKKPTGLNR